MKYRDTGFISLTKRGMGRRWPQMEKGYVCSVLFEKYVRMIKDDCSRRLRFFSI